MENTYFFDHDYNTRNTKKMLRMRAHYGADGAKAYGIFWMIVETMQESSSADISFDDIPGLAMNFIVDKVWLKELVDYCILIDLFFTDDAVSCFSASRVQEHKNFRKALSEKRSQAGKARWDKDLSKCNANAVQVLSKTMQRKGKERKRNKNISIAANVPFAEFWDLYDKKKGDREKLENKWHSLSDQERDAIMAHIPKYKLEQPDKSYRKNPQTYLNQKSWNDEVISQGTTTTPLPNKLRF